MCVCFWIKGIEKICLSLATPALGLSSITIYTAERELARFAYLCHHPFHKQVVNLGSFHWALSLFILFSFPVQAFMLQVT